MSAPPPKRSDAEIMGAADELLAALMAAETPSGKASSTKAAGLEGLLANLGKALEANHAQGNGDEWQGKPKQNELWGGASATTTTAPPTLDGEPIEFEVVTKHRAPTDADSEGLDALVGQFCTLMREGQRQGADNLLPFKINTTETSSDTAVEDAAVPFVPKGRTQADADNMSMAELCEELSRMHAAKLATRKSEQ
eukprot:TRINITY_DN39529_c0_g1_i1.p1 TRINITY_DN39529_c0_g1~~TRINITY_DN39529_c0_g1_i1.p1  ORF type:complete len:196 (+),score=64.59 TRINITY_DN39529_c0_g1_i1:34-621(+)